MMKNLKDFMEEPDQEKATIALQRRYETVISKDKGLHKKACFGAYFGKFKVSIRVSICLQPIHHGQGSTADFPKR